MRFDWMSPGARMWRQKLGAFCRMLRLNSDNYQQFLKEWFFSEEESGCHCEPVARGGE